MGRVSSLRGGSKQFAGGSEAQAGSLLTTYPSSVATGSRKTPGLRRLQKWRAAVRGRVFCRAGGGDPCIQATVRRYCIHIGVRGGQLSRAPRLEADSRIEFPRCEERLFGVGWGSPGWGNLTDLGPWRAPNFRARPPGLLPPAGKYLALQGSRGAKSGRQGVGGKGQAAWGSLEGARKGNLTNSRSAAGRGAERARASAGWPATLCRAVFGVKRCSTRGQAKGGRG